MKNLAVFPILLGVLILQSAVVSRLMLLSGFADLVLLLLTGLALHKQANTAWHWAVLFGLGVGFMSAAPVWAVVAGYLGVVGLARLMQRRVWESPVLAMFLVTFAGTLWIHALTYVGLFFAGTSLPFEDTFSLVTLPSLFINMILAIPAYTLVRDLANWLYDVERMV